MTGANTTEYRNRLLAMATRLGATVAGLVEQVSIPTGGEAAGGMSNTPIHLGDIGSEAYNQELGATLLENESFLSDEVATALERLERGTYETCEHCGKSIGIERLDALPYARHCVTCAAKSQSGLAVNLNDGRPTNRLGAFEGLSQTNRVVGQELGDVHAAGTPGGGTAVGGLAGTNIGRGAPDGVNLEQTAGGLEIEVPDEAEEEALGAFSGVSGGAIGGTPANKRAHTVRGNVSSNINKPTIKPKKNSKKRSA
jgi:RNA polymerase-binding transcription factor DksA